MTQNIHLHIDRIVLNGLDIPPSQRDRLKAVIGAELTRLLSEHVLSSHQLLDLNTHPTMPKLSIEVTLNPKLDLFSTGQQISQTIYEHVFS